MSTGLVAITKGGARLARQVATATPGSRIFASGRCADEAGPTAEVFTGRVGDVLAEHFHEFDTWIAFVSLGAVVRLAAPALKGKDVDPAVVVVDEAARFAIAALSGHWGGANAEAERIAGILGAQPVITTASDANRTIAVDILGRELGWQVEASHGELVAASAAVVNDEPVAVVQETGEPGWWRHDAPLPDNIHWLTTPPEDPDAWGACLWITDRLLGEAEAAPWAGRLARYRPRSLYLGVGCDRGAARETVATAIDTALTEAGLSPLAVGGMATIDKKQDEPALHEASEARGWPLHFYPAEELAAVPGIPNPSETVQRYMGTPAVGEPAALLAAGAEADRLMVEKRKYCGADGKNATVSIARAPFPEPGANQAS